MPKMSPPHSTAVVDVSKNDVDRYREAGWTEAKSGSKRSSDESTSKKSTARRSSSEK